MKKTCKKCGITKDVNEFYKNKLTKDGLESYCKECKRELVKGRSQRDTYQGNKSFVESLKTPCVKCGEDRPWVIQFHHIDPSTKKFEVANVSTRSKSALLEEINKCVCLCSNCHDEFHYFYGLKVDDPVESLEEYLSE